METTTIGALYSIVERHAAAADVDAIGIGVNEGALLMTFQQDVPLAAVIGGGLLAVLLSIAAFAAVSARRKATMYRQIARYESKSREAERASLARELHDGPLQQLSLLARSDFESAPELRERLRSVAKEVRSVAAALRPPALDRFGLGPALEDLAARWETAPTPLAVRVRAEGLNLSTGAELAVYRVAQEALTNAAKHGQAQTAWVFVQCTADAAELIIRDDGVGIDERFSTGAPDRLVREGHFGLAGMAERASALSGSLAVGRGPGRSGTEVRLTIPIGAVEARGSMRLAA
ncbi:hypothetical protein BSZ36_17395 [Rubricoccus marinus]|uniref:histidine kinase n=1 Tax=Rubricoccus marinus TaxID=716817 RepID=A0A259TUK6_9BACT|nr:hypothetical protein BSZ36_17395 [Rubricoccus marinus]